MRVGKTHGIFVRSADRSGFHLIELLVLVSTMSLLLVLLVPAVQESREKARMARCASNLRQLGLATRAYVDAFNAFPAALAAPSSGLQRQYSVFTQILHHLGQTQVFNGINFEAGIQDFYIFKGDERYQGFLAMNSTSLATSLETLLCPADRGPDLRGATAGCTYRANLGAEYVSSVDGSNRGTFFNFRGSAFGEPMSSGPEAATRGPFSNGELVTPATITDGLANTVIFSEKLRGDPSRKEFDPRTDMMVGRLQHYWDGGRTRTFCNPALAGGQAYYTSAGATWLVGALSQTCYNHFDTPNSEDPDCALLRTFNPIRGRMAAQSNHSYGVQAAMADASVRFVGETIDRRAWRALGTRARRDSEGF